jgi:hypothetical protein
LKDERLVQQGNRLRLAREHAGYVSGRMAAERLGWKHATYAAHESGMRGIPAKVAEKYAREFRVHPDFLLFGTRPPDWWSGDSIVTATGLPTRSLKYFQTNEVEPIVAYLNGGDPLAGQFAFRDDGSLPPRTFALLVRSSEMQPRVPVAGEFEFAPGDTVIAAPAEHVTPGHVVVLRVGSEARPYLRRVRQTAPGQLEFTALNPDFGVVGEAEATPLARVIIHIRRL